MTQIKADKKCSCGKSFPFVPAGHTKNEIGYWWNCSCGSTLLLRSIKLEITANSLDEEDPKDFEMESQLNDLVREQRNR